MSKVVVAGDSVVITSDLKFKDLQVVKKYRPDALILKNKEDEVIFSVDTTSGIGCISKHGVVFNSETRDDKQLALITLDLPRGVENVKEYVAETYGSAITNLEKVEAVLPDILKEAADAKAKVMESVTIM